MKKIFILFTLPLTLLSCGGDYKSPEAAGNRGSFSGQQLNVINGNLTIGNSIEGTGSVVFQEELSEVEGKKSYAIDFNLQEGGCLDLVSYSRESLDGGWEIQFCRQGTGAGSLKVTVFANGERRDTQKPGGIEAFGGFDASGPLKVQIDVHNDESPTHALVWSRALPIDFTEDSAIFNTEENDNSPGVGSGKRFGLRLNKAQVTAFAISEAKFRE